MKVVLFPITCDHVLVPDKSVVMFADTLLMVLAEYACCHAHQMPNVRRRGVLQACCNVSSRVLWALLHKLRNRLGVNCFHAPELGTLARECPSRGKRPSKRHAHCTLWSTMCNSISGGHRAMRLLLARARCKAGCQRPGPCLCRTPPSATYKAYDKKGHCNPCFARHHRRRGMAT